MHSWFRRRINMASAKTSAFEKLSPGPFQNCHKAIALSSTRFVSIPGEIEFVDSVTFIFMYDVITNQWSRLHIDRDEAGHHYIFDVIFDDKHNLLHVFSQQPSDDCHGHISTINVRTNTFCEPLKADYGRSNILIGDRLHIFKYIKSYLYHSVVDTVSGERIKGLELIDKGRNHMEVGTILFVESRNSIIVKGWDFCYGEYSGQEPQVHHVVVWEYPLSHRCSDKQWDRWNWIPEQFRGYSSIATVFTNDGLYMISLGGCVSGRHRLIFTKDIVVYDLKRRRCMKSAVLCPVEDCRAILMGNKEGDEKLAFGFVHRIFKDSDYRDIPILPRYLIQLIGKWISMQYIHIIERRFGANKCQHWRVNVDEILRSVLEKL